MNHQVIARPNSSAVFSALGVYLDVMRPFVVQNLPVHLGKTKASTLLRDALPVEMRGDFDKRWTECNGDESLTIDVTHIPHIVRKNWDLSFASEFKGQRNYIGKMAALAKYRNMVCHPSTADFSHGQTESVFHCIEKITTQIDREDACERVSWIRQRLTAGCCSDCPESHMRLDTTGQEEVEREMLRMQAELAALSDELSAIRSKPRLARKSAFTSKLVRLVPRVSFRFSVAFGDNHGSVADDTRDSMAQIGDVSVSESMTTGEGPDEIANERKSSSNGHSIEEAGPELVRLKGANKP